MELMHRKVLLYGMGATGRSVVETLLPRGAEITLVVDGGLRAEDQAFLDALPDGETVRVAEEPHLDAVDFVLRASGIRPDQPLLKEARARGIPVWTDLELAYRIFGGARMIAITGSNGKTTTTSLLAHLLQEAGKAAIACGNIGVPVLTTMDRVTADTWFVVECSSFQLEGVDTFAPHRAAVLNITPDHIDWHGSFAAYADQKAKIAHAQKKGDIVWIHPTDRALQAAFERIVPGGEVRPVSFTTAFADTLRRGEGFRLVGEHNVENAVFAVEIAKDLGLTEAEIRDGLMTFRPIPHRMEEIATVAGVRYINDSKGTNVDATVRALQGIHAPLLLIAGGYDKHVSYDALFPAFRPIGKKLILMGATAPQLEREAKEAGLSEMVVMKNTLEEAFRAACAAAEPGDMVLLSPASASWDQYAHFEERGDAFRALVEEWKEKGSH